MFLGRERELRILQKLQKLKKASCVVCRGRRRIGKSTLIEQFGKDFSKFYEFQGLAPRLNLNNQDQLDNFSEQLADQLGLPTLTFKNWTEAFALLAQQTAKGSVLILLDEISWMASADADFLGQLKIAWDTKFKKNDRLILVLCGSVTSWIDANILGGSDFVGRVSATITLEELALPHCHEFWGKNKKHISSFEKFKLLSITGGVPKYLEEIDFSDTAENNIKRMCFSPDGNLFTEFNKIFNDIFMKRAPFYKEIVSTLVQGKLSFTQICQKLKTIPSGVLTNYLKDLEISGFIARDFNYNRAGQRTKLSHYRIKDNYLRFYLKYIEPNKEKIEEKLFEFKSLENLPGWESIMGFQFESLVLNNKAVLYELLEIPTDSILSSAPYFQNKTQRTKSCQIDWLIQTKHTLYVCEIKFRKKITSDCINEVAEKISRLKYPKTCSIRPVLIYEGELSTELKNESYFSKSLNFAALLEA